MTVCKARLVMAETSECPWEVCPSHGGAGCVEPLALDDLAVLVHCAAAESGLRPEELLGNISDEVLATLYLDCAADVRRRTIGITGRKEHKPS